MKRLTLTFGLLLALSGLLPAQYAITFQVDMGNVATIADTVSVAGDFQVAAGYPADWARGVTLMTDGNNDSIYEVTVNLPAMPDTLQYKFVNGGVNGSWEPVPGACAVNQNREVIIAGNTTIPVVCFSKCDSCVSSVDTVKVTLRVDMTNETTGDTVSVAGDFQLAAGFSGDWTPGATVLTDANMDNIWEGTFDIPVGTYQYKFINGKAWGDDESVPSACAVNNNREMIITGPNDTTIQVVCFASCLDTCTPPLPAINVTFRVNMANEIVSSAGVFVAGTFQDPAWVKDTFKLTDGNMDQVYQFTTKIVPNEYQYRYYNGDGGDPDAETANFAAAGCGVSNGIGGWNRLLDITGQLTDTILPVYDYNTCNISVNVEDKVANPAFFEVFPNPASGSATVRLGGLTEAYTLSVTDITGKIVSRESGLNAKETTVSVESLEPGMYFVTVTTNAARFTRKLVVE